MTNVISIKLSDFRTRNRMDACYYVALNLHKERVKILLEKDIDDLRKIATLIGNNKKALQAVGKGTFAKFNPETYNKEEVALYIAIAEQEVLTELSENIAKYQNIKNELESLLARK